MKKKCFLLFILFSTKAISDPHPFNIGEKFLFSIEWGFIKAGYATLEVRDTITISGKSCYIFTSNAWSNPTFSSFFMVKDSVHSYTIKKDLASLKFEKHLNEGTFKADIEVIFDQETHKAQYSDGTLVNINPDSRDILATFYYARTIPLEVGKSIFIDNHTDKVNYPLEVKVLRRERVKVHAGEFDCIVLEPLLRYPGLFQQKGKLTIWLTDDRRRMPVLMKSKIIIGSINASLKEYRFEKGGSLIK